MGSFTLLSDSAWRWLKSLLCEIGFHDWWLTGEYSSGFGFDRFFVECSRCDAAGHIDSSDFLLHRDTHPITRATSA